MRPDPVLFPDATELYLDHLATELDSRGYELPGHSEIPNPRPSEWFRVMRAGGPRANWGADRPQLIFEAWADDDIAAHDWAQILRALVLGSENTVLDGVQVYRIDELSGPGSLPDPDSGQHRYTFQVAPMLRGATLPEGS